MNKILFTLGIILLITSGAFAQQTKHEQQARNECNKEKRVDSLDQQSREYTIDKLLNEIDDYRNLTPKQRRKIREHYLDLIEQQEQNMFIFLDILSEKEDELREIFGDLEKDMQKLFDEMDVYEEERNDEHKERNRKNDYYYDDIYDNNIGMKN